MALDPEMVRQRLGELDAADTEIRDNLAVAFRELRDELHGLANTVREVNASLVTEIAGAEERFERYTKEVNDKVVKRIDDHESRIRILERRVWGIFAVVAVAAFLSPFIERHWPW